MKTCGDFGGTTKSGKPCSISVKEGRCGLHAEDAEDRRELLSDQQIEEVRRLAQLTCSQEEIAHVLGIGERTLRKRMNDQDGVRAAYQEGKAKAQTFVKGKLRELIKAGDKTAIIFYLKTQCGWSEKRRVEHSGEVDHSHETDIPYERISSALQVLAGEAPPDPGDSTADKG